MNDQGKHLAALAKLNEDAKRRAAAAEMPVQENEDDDIEPFKRVDLAVTPEQSNLPRQREQANAEDIGSNIYRFTPSERDSQLSQPLDADGAGLIKDREAVFLNRKQALKNNLFNGNFNGQQDDEDMFDDHHKHTSGQLLDQDFNEEDFKVTRHFSESNKKVQQSKQEANKQQEEEKEAAPEVTQFDRNADNNFILLKPSVETSRNDMGLTGEINLANTYHSPNNHSKNNQSLEDSLNQRESRSSIDIQQLFWPNRTDLSERDFQSKVSSKLTQQLHPQQQDKNATLKGSKKFTKSPQVKEYNKFQSSLQRPKQIRSPGKQKPTSKIEQKLQSPTKFKTNQNLNQSILNRSKGNGSKLSTSKVSNYKPRVANQTTKNAKTKINNFFRSPQMSKIVQSKPVQKQIKPIVPQVTERSDIHNKSIENIGETGQSFNNIFTPEQYDDMLEKIDSEIESPNTPIDPRTNQQRATQGVIKYAGPNSRTKVQKNGVIRKIHNSFQDAVHVRDLKVDDNFLGMPAEENLQSLEQSKIENEGQMLNAPNYQSTPKQITRFVINQNPKTPKTFQPSSIGRKQSIIKKSLGIKSVLDRESFNDGDKFKNRSSKCTPKNQNNSQNKRMSVLRGSRGSDGGLHSRNQPFTNPVSASFATKIDKISKLDNSLPSSQQPSANTKSAQKNSMSAMRNQRLKAGSPQLMRHDPMKPLTLQLSTYSKENRANIIQRAEKHFMKNERRGTVFMGQNDLMAQYSSVQPSTVKARTAIKNKLNQSPEYPYAKLIGMVKAPNNISNTSKKQPRGAIKLMGKGQSQVGQKAQAQPKSSQFERIDSGQSERQQVLPEGQIKQIKQSFLEKVNTQLDNRNPNKNPMMNYADITQSQEDLQIKQPVNISNKNNKRSDLSQSNEQKQDVSEFQVQETANVTPTKENKPDEQNTIMVLNIDGQISLGQPVQMQTQGQAKVPETIHQPQTLGVQQHTLTPKIESKQMLNILVKKDQTVGSIEELLAVFGVKNFDKEQYSFTHENAKITIDTNKLASELMSITGREKNPNTFHYYGESYTDRIQAINQVGMNNPGNRSQTVIGQNTHFEHPTGPSSIQNGRQNLAPSENNLDPNLPRLPPHRMKSAVSQKQSRSGNKSTHSRQNSKHSKGFQNVREQHQERLKLSRMRTNSRQNINQRLKSSDSKALALYESQSNPGSFIETSQQALDNQNPSLQVQHFQTETQQITIPQSLMSPAIFKGSQQSQSIIQPNQMQSQYKSPRSQDFIGSPQDPSNPSSSHKQSMALGIPTQMISSDTKNTNMMSPHQYPIGPLKSPQIRSQDEPLQNQPNKIDLAFLFASPLMLKTSDTGIWDVLPPISFEDEFFQIRQGIEEKNVEFNFRYKVATSENLLKVLRENPVGLHFSGHGFKNAEVIYEGDKKAWMKNKNKGDVLIFENEDGTSEFFFQNDLKQMFKNVSEQLNRLKQDEKEAKEQKDKEGQDQNLESSLKIEKLEDRPTNLQFVFVASCHAEKVAEIFGEIGVPHVICVNQNQRILDKAAVDFSKAFYAEVFDKFCTICEAYSKAKAIIDKEYGKFHAEKILLKTYPQHKQEECQSKDHRLEKRKKGEMQRLDYVSDYNFFPNKVRPFLFRNRDMYDVLKLLTERKIVQIYGMPGLGKSALLKNVTVFLGERNYYKDGLVYIDYRQITTFQEAINIMSLYLQRADDYEYDQFQMSFNPDHALTDKTLIRNILGPMKKFMFALDNIDDLEKQEYTTFLEFIIELSQNTSVKFIFTSDRIMPGMTMAQGDIGVKLLKRLTQQESVELFLTKIPLSETDRQRYFQFSQIKELHEQTQKFYEEKKIKKDLPKLCALRNCQHGFGTCVKKYLLEHPMFEFFMGTPLVISIIAPFTVTKSLKELCIDLWQKRKEQNEQSEDDDNIMNTDIDQFYIKSLLDSLDYCTQYFQEQGKNGNVILEMWYIIGLNGPGILENDLKQIVQSAKIQPQEEEENDSFQKKMNEQFYNNLEQLATYSVIESENVDSAGKIKRLKVGPMINNYINRKLDSNDTQNGQASFKETSLQIVCVHIKDLLVELKKNYSNEIMNCKNDKEVKEKEDALADKIKLYEPQIMHLIQQSIKLIKKKEDEADDADEVDSFNTDDSMQDLNILDNQDQIQNDNTKQPGNKNLANPAKTQIQKQQNNIDGQGLNRQNLTGTAGSNQFSNTDTMQSHGLRHSQQSNRNAMQDQKSQKSQIGKHKRKQSGKTEMKPHVSQEYRDMRMTIRLDPKNKLSDIMAENEDNDDLDIDHEKEMLKLAMNQDNRAGSEILQNQNKSVRKMGPSEREIGNMRNSLKSKNSESLDGKDEPFELKKSPLEKQFSLKLEGLEKKLSVIPSQLDMIKEISDDQFIASLKDKLEEQSDDVFDPAFQATSQSIKLLINNQGDNQDEKDQDRNDQQVTKSPRYIITSSRRHQPFNPQDDEEQELKPEDFPQVKQMDKNKSTKSYKWGEEASLSAKSDQHHDETAVPNEDTQQNIEEQEDQQEKQKFVNNFLADHQREMGVQEKEENNEEQEQDTYHFSQTVSALEIAKQLQNELNMDQGSDGFANTMNKMKFNESLIIANRDELSRQTHKQMRKRQKTILKKTLQNNIDPLQYDLGKSELFKIRQSIFEKSQKKSSQILLDMQKNPDMAYSSNQSGQKPNDISGFKKVKDQILDDDDEDIESMKEPDPIVPPMNKNKSQMPPLYDKKKSPPKLRIQQTDFQSRFKSPRARIPTNQKQQQYYKVEKTYQLQHHEELLFHYLSILALIPKERPKVLVILDTFRYKNSKQQDDQSTPGRGKDSAGLKQSTFDVMQNQGQKNLNDQSTFIAIPEQAKLLQANTLMLELYVWINEDLKSIMDYMNLGENSQVKKPNLGYDRVYEEASSISLIYEEIQFNRGLAIMEYIQAMRLIKRQRKMEFKKKIKSCALKFEQVHEACGIQQCIDLAKESFDLPKPKDASANENNDGNAQSLNNLQKRKWQSGTEELEDNLRCIQYLEARLKNLTDSKDQQVQDFVKYRKENKIPNLSAYLKQNTMDKKAVGQQEEKQDQMIHVDRVLNMLLNPQFHHTVIKEI